MKSNCLPKALLVPGAEPVDLSVCKMGGYSDVYEGSLNEKKVALKSLRVIQSERKLQQVKKEGS